jgi:predicted MFS family arabinose efflux permease
MSASTPACASEPPLWAKRATPLCNERIPQYARAVFAALRFEEPDATLLQKLDSSDWPPLLKFCDESQLTLILHNCCGAVLPPGIQSRIRRNLVDNTRRFANLQAAYFEITEELASRRITFVLLKGFAHSPDFTPDPILRAQGDIDLWIEPGHVLAARDALLTLGYRPVSPSEGRHLAPMMRPTDWQWRGDYFAPDLPIGVDLHYQLWDSESEFIAIPDEPQFWNRRTCMQFAGRGAPVLSSIDTFAFASLHLLMHLLHGDLRLHRAWEIAHFLHAHSGNTSLWADWSQLHSPRLRRLEAIVSVLAAKWFGCDLPDCIQTESEALSDDIQLWIERYSTRPVEALFVPNKDELWLHLALLESLQDKTRIFRRRLIPIRLPRLSSVGGNTERSTTEARKRQILFLRTRLWRHSRTLLPTLSEGVHWWWLRQGLGREFTRFLIASLIFDFGAFIFFLLYNLYLLECGYHEQLIGQVASAMTAGTVLASIPAPFLTRRLGLRRILLIAILGGAAACSLRVLASNQAMLLGSALLNGAFFSLWAVSLSPAVASFTTEKTRPFAFSVISGSGIAIGLIAGVMGGRLPGFLMHALPVLGSLGSKRASLMMASVLIALAAIPACTLHGHTGAALERKVYPRNRFIVVFLIWLFVWSAATGAFNPFFNVYLANRHFSVEQIGLVFSSSQLVQVAAIFLAPAAFQRFGSVRAITCMQVLTGVCLGLLSISTHQVAAIAAYIGYMAFQYMSEPGLLSMLMDRVSPAERSGASAFNFLVTAMAGSVAAFAAGALFPQFGYTLVLACAAILIIVAASLFRFLIHEEA